ncbi:hypothetical protein BJ741DRAFT_405144 [Chytriomyces cf. hyalinus JEL632]|nr:hypothetical protein BJ741DRAFT_405144 [Chytriomyces cf. hyalinus JEL632]
MYKFVLNGCTLAPSIPSGFSQTLLQWRRQTISHETRSSSGSLERSRSLCRQHRHVCWLHIRTNPRATNYPLSPHPTHTHYTPKHMQDAVPPRVLSSTSTAFFTAKRPSSTVTTQAPTPPHSTASSCARLRTTALQNQYHSYIHEANAFDLDELCLQDLEQIAFERHELYKDRLQRLYRESMDLWIIRSNSVVKPEPAAAAAAAAAAYARSCFVAAAASCPKHVVVVVVNTGARACSNSAFENEGVLQANCSTTTATPTAPTPCLHDATSLDCPLAAFANFVLQCPDGHPQSS